MTRALPLLLLAASACASIPPRAPMAVCVADVALADATAAAVTAWPSLRYAGPCASRSAAVVVSADGRWLNTRRVAQTVRVTDRGVQTVVVQVHRATPARYGLHAALVHELGHVTGAQHDYSGAMGPAERRR